MSGINYQHVAVVTDEPDVVVNFPAAAIELERAAGDNAPTLNPGGLVPHSGGLRDQLNPDQTVTGTRHPTQVAAVRASRASDSVLAAG